MSIHEQFLQASIGILHLKILGAINKEEAAALLEKLENATQLKMPDHLKS
jgi:hypothetical protein